MSSSSKRIGLSASHDQQRPSILGISVLSSDILSHVISFLPALDAARACLLSSRWRYLYRSCPNPLLDFEYPYRFSNRERKKLFLDFVSETVNRRINYPGPISRLRVSYDRIGSFAQRLIKSWISSVVPRGVQEIVLDVGRFTDVEDMLPSIIFTCQTLEVLQLQSDGGIGYVPRRVCFPNLKVLHLNCLTIDARSEDKRIFSSCRVLEELSVEVFRFQSDGYPLRVRPMPGAAYEDTDQHVGLPLPIPTLKRLSIRELRSVPRSSGCEVLIDAPCLVEARVGLMCNWPTTALRLFSGIYGMKFLRLGMNYLQKATRCCLPAFPNLTRFELEYPKIPTYGLDLKMLFSILQSATRLQVLVFLKSFAGWSSGYIEEIWGEDVPSCLSWQMQEIEMNGFQGKEDEIAVVQYFLESAHVLQRLTIVSHMPSSTEFFVRNKIDSFQRCSIGCEVELVQV